MEVLSEALMAQFIQRMVVHLKTHFPQEMEAHQLRQPDLEMLVVNGIDQAKEYGVVNENDVRLYLEYQLLLCPSFDTDPDYVWASKILQRDDLTGCEKMQKIHNHWVFLMLGKS